MPVILWKMCVNKSLTCLWLCADGQSGGTSTDATRHVSPHQRILPFTNRGGCFAALQLFCPGFFAWFLSFLEEHFLKCKSLQRYLAIMVEPIIYWLKFIDFHLQVSHTCRHQTILEDPTHLRQMPGQQHGNLKRVTIVGFCYARSLVELAC
jgi:hypothetical protein